jgi:hypothetical protein
MGISLYACMPSRGGICRYLHTAFSQHILQDSMTDRGRVDKCRPASIACLRPVQIVSRTPEECPVRPENRSLGILENGHRDGSRLREHRAPHSSHASVACYLRLILR